ncbi:alpha-glucuronidase [Virgibacillus natechei]|uniref:Xylan alpha-1,2-glucuronidase n=1 Tax=Virgibacillus natechei TaxID=1216297 RepID=A0ABS4IFD5_9BACI|nr:alpha-glucuronidase family glycosyl hydrolase [Virgibacillus natechei]MBP1969335.1 alpha-glucuronidase [Virgibacillus natechei]UZD12486.1 alpha-glucuronidase [Virgibacillus natechei]
MLENAIKNEQTLNNVKGYRAWLQYSKIEDKRMDEEYRSWFSAIGVAGDTSITNSAIKELSDGIESMLDVAPTVNVDSLQTASIILGTYQDIWIEDYGMSPELFGDLNNEGYVLKTTPNDNGEKKILLIGKTDKGILYATYHLLRLIQSRKPIHSLDIVDAPKNQFRMMNQWDNIDGTIERGYSGKSIFYYENDFSEDLERIKDYARLLSSTGLNAISINNVNVWDVETNLISKQYLPKVERVANIFRAYGITLFLSINYASPIALGNLDTADPLDEKVRAWWKKKVEEIYQYIPDFGGFIVKADSENRPGPFSYDRDHADGANVLAEALKPFNGILIWRCFVYNNLQDWRDRSTDRARAAYDNFKPIDGQFLDNVILQIKNGPMDFQVREPVSPLLGALKKTNQLLELQVAQEYTGQQKDVCYLIPQWKEILDFDTYAKGEGTKIKNIAGGTTYNNSNSGIAAVSNIGNDINWTGNTLAQANLYGFGRLTWNPDLTTEEITRDWIHLTFGHDPLVVENIEYILLNSWKTYENYTVPLGIGWMVNPGHHYGPNIDGYEYSAWGTYHFADRDGIGVDRTVETGTGYTSQYFPPNVEWYNSLDSCPDELLLFFHHVPYTHVLKSGETVIQHIYNTHFKGVEEVEDFIYKWDKLVGSIDNRIFENVKERLYLQLKNATDWRDKINTYFYRKSGISDNKNRTIY